MSEGRVGDGTGRLTLRTAPRPGTGPLQPKAPSQPGGANQPAPNGATPGTAAGMAGDRAQTGPLVQRPPSTLALPAIPAAADVGSSHSAGSTRLGEVSAFADGREVAADVRVGVDAGEFFCDGMTEEVAELANPTPGQDRGSEAQCKKPTTGFLHIPPDEQTGAAYNREGALTREQNHRMTANVLGDAVRGVDAQNIAPQTTVLLTGFGGWSGVTNNPTGAFVQNADGTPNQANLDRVAQRAGYQTPGTEVKDGAKVLGYSYGNAAGKTLNLVTGTLAIQDRTAAGTQDRSMANVREQFHSLQHAAQRVGGGRVDGVIAMGVSPSSHPEGGRPRYTFESVGRGADDGDPYHNHEGRRNTGLIDCYRCAHRH